MWNDKVVEGPLTKRVSNTPSIILDADSYKMSHFAMYPENTNAMFSYIEARTTGDTIIPFGLQMWIKKNLLTPITLANINEAEDICKLHGVPFNRAGWEYILDKYNGFLPIKIRGIPEGTPTPSQTPLFTVECTDPEVWWLASSIETSLQRGVWYPTTIASNDYKSYTSLKNIYDTDSDNPVMLDFALHSFGSRGVSSRETAEVGGLAHLIFFKGTDDLVALKAGRDYYNCEMAGFSVVASEHSVQCSYGIDNQAAYLNRVLDVYGTSGGIVSVVMDGYDIYREVDLLCSEKFVTKVKNSDCKFVVRPDSGDPFVVIPILLEKLANAYGTTKNSKGKLVLNNVGIIQGDGINSTSLKLLSQKVHGLGYAPECVIYGSGGGLLQKVDRDTYSFAQKTSAIRIGEDWIPTVKSPITDSGKKSKGGRLDNDQFITYYENGKLLVDESLETVRKRALT